MEIAPNIAVTGFMEYKTPSPNTVSSTPNTKAERTVIRPAGNGRSFVLSISASKSRSTIWLNTLEAPTIAYPPTHRRKSTKKSMFSASNKYPATEENNTLMESLNLVISVKLRNMECTLDWEWLMDKLIF